MRIVQVSGHYPPNFVSGGTLVPQRVARAVAQAGDESYVFAGYLGEAREPLSTWTEDDEYGVHVTWLVTTPWTAWDDPKNWDNPEATAAFERWLEQVTPDVVHFHSIQTLGVGLVEAAHRSGAKVVVTMHDFWWLCSRQFLVGEDMRPTSLVVECGTCDCERAGGELAGREERLRRALADVDLILAPSRSAARVFEANGIDSQRLEVDENGLPDEQLTMLQGNGSPDARQGDGPLRLMYAGGAQAMKGYDVLVGAVRSLGEINGAVLDMYGTADAGLTGLPAWVRPHPAFAPEQLRAVLNDHDVLVLPSVMRESHSILTREALAAGLAVVCTDTLGPEEAVADGVNGWIVPAGDVFSLAAMISRLASDPADARRLTGKGSISPIRAFSDQAAGLIARYHGLLDGTLPATSGDDAMRAAQAGLLRRVLFVVGINGAPLRYRAQLPAEALGMLGHEVEVRHYRDPELTSLVERADAVVFYRVPATTQVLELIRTIKERPEPVPVLYDVDDLIFDPTLRGSVDGLKGMGQEELDLWWHGVDRYRTTMEACDGYVGSTTTLCQRATEVAGMPTYRFANGVGMLLARASDQALTRPRASGPLRIGYFSGTTTHDVDWAMVEPAVLAILERHPEVVLRLGGHLRPTPALERFGDRIERVPFTQWYRLPEVLRDTDICLAPLTPGSVFNEAKSAIKWLEAALVATPTVASPTEPFREAIEDGRTGLLASTTQEWEQALEQLVSDSVMRARIGALARREALLRWAPRVQGRRYESLLVDAALKVRTDGHRSGSAWVDVADDEPFSSVDAQVDPYDVDEARVVAPPRPSRLKRYSHKAWDVFKQEGPTAVIRRGGRVIKRRLSS